jgi:hypothetical protein
MNNPHFQKCFLSELGHKNFWYPTAVQALLSTECESEALSWIAGDGRNLKALKVRKACILPLSSTPPTSDIVNTHDGDCQIVVWVEK